MVNLGGLFKKEGQLTKFELLKMRKYIIASLSNEALCELWISAHQNFHKKVGGNQLDESVTVFEIDNEDFVQINRQFDGWSLVTFFLGRGEFFRFLVNADMTFKRYKNEYYDIDAFFGRNMKHEFVILFQNFFSLMYGPFPYSNYKFDPSDFFHLRLRIRKTILALREIHQGEFGLRSGKGTVYNTDLYIANTLSEVNVYYTPGKVPNYKPHLRIYCESAKNNLYVEFDNLGEIEDLHDTEILMSLKEKACLLYAIDLFLSDRKDGIAPRECGEKRIFPFIKERYITERENSKDVEQNRDRTESNEPNKNQKMPLLSATWDDIEINSEIQYIEGWIKKLDEESEDLDIILGHEYERLKGKLFPNLTRSYLMLDSTLQEKKKDAFVKSLRVVGDSLSVLYEKIQQQKEYAFDRQVEMILNINNRL